MPKNTSGGKQKTGDAISPPAPPTTNQMAGTTKTRGSDRAAGTINTDTNSVQRPADVQKSGKPSRPAIGGTAVVGARSTQPRQLSENANPQQQQMESYNRDMRRRMERMGYNDTQQKVHTVQDQRKKRAERLKQRRQEQISHVKRSLPGGKVDTNTTRVYIMIAVVAVAIILLILVFAFIRHLI